MMDHFNLPVLDLARSRSFGLLWNLEANESWDIRDQRHFRFSFARRDWPNRPVDTRFAPLIAPAIPFILLAAFVLVAFVGWNFVMFRR